MSNNVELLAGIKALLAVDAENRRTEMLAFEDRLAHVMSVHKQLEARLVDIEKGPRKPTDYEHNLVISVAGNKRILGIKVQYEGDEP